MDETIVPVNCKVNNDEIIHNKAKLEATLCFIDIGYVINLG